MRRNSNPDWGLHNKHRKNKKFLLIILAVLALLFLGLFLFQHKKAVTDYEKDAYAKSIEVSEFPVDTLCVANEDVFSETYQTDNEFHAAALFQLDTAEVLHAENIHEKLYPASTTKILTAYLALKYGTLTDVITISENAIAVPSDSSTAGLRLGDQLTLEELLYSLLLPSGNDSAVAIAEYISGSEDAFVELMNEEARKLGATNSNFVSPHGYHDENHYTTAYDLYLIFNACIQDDTFLKIISTSEYEMNITEADGSLRKTLWKQSNQYINGLQSVPEGFTVVGGKTGTTDEAGSCLILYAKDSDEHPYISILMGADTKSILYEDMTHLISVANTTNK